MHLHILHYNLDLTAPNTVPPRDPVIAPILLVKKSKGEYRNTAKFISNDVRKSLMA